MNDDIIQPAAEDRAPDSGPTEVEKQRDEYLDGWKRAKADLQNFKKSETERFTSIVKFANETFIAELLSILDSFDLGLAALADGDPAKQGMRLIRGQLEEALKRQGLERISALPGESFDPARHEAVGEMPGQHPPNTVAKEVSAGYSLHGKVIRAAKILI
jgi:molecular chaperone GrpE